MKDVRIGVLGYGYWGPNLVRNFSMAEGCEIAAICDPAADRAALAKKAHPSVRIVSRPEDVLSDPSIDAVVLATPVSTHGSLARIALEAGKHVLVEKPFVTSLSEARELTQLAEKKKRVLMVDFPFLYSPAVQKISSLIAEGALGHIQYFDSIRINLGLFQSDTNVFWDLASHDLAILLHLFKEKPVLLQASGACHTNNKIENIGYMTLHYPSGMIAHLNSSWCSPVKIRQILIGGDKKMVLYNDMEPTEKVKIYDTGIRMTAAGEDRRKILVDYRVGDVYLPKLPFREALAGMAKDFLSAIQTGSQPVSSNAIALEVIRLLEAADQSMRQQGRETRLDG